METNPPQRKIWVIDHHDGWRFFYENTLTDDGYSVRSFKDYDGPKCDISSSCDSPDLVILGCGKIRGEECRLTRQLTGKGYHIVVLATGGISELEGRSMFDPFARLPKGHEDVTEKPPDTRGLLNIVRRVFRNIRRRSSYRTAEAELEDVK